MTSILRQLAPFAAVLAVLYAAGYAAGTIIDADADRGGGGGHAMQDEPAAHEQAAHEEGDLRLALDRRAAWSAARASSSRSASRPPRARPVRAFDLEHERRMHLIVVRTDLTGFQHVHPREGADGTWTVPLTLAAAGTYRVFADFSTGGEGRTLDADVQVPGAFAPQPLPHPEPVARDRRLRGAPHGHGRRRALHGAPRRAGRSTTSSRTSAPAATSSRCARATSPSSTSTRRTRRPRAATSASASSTPRQGRYRLFLQFQHDGRVHTAAFTQEVGGDGHGRLSASSSPSRG